MKNKYLQKFITKTFSALVAASVFMGTAINPLAANDLTDHIEHSDENFEDFEYVEMKESDFDNIVKGLDGIVDDTSKADEVLQVIIDMEDYYSNLEASSTIAYLYTQLDVDDEEYDEKYKYSDELSTTISDKIYINYNLIANSENADVLKERIDDEDEWQEILDYKPMTDTQKELFKRETELSLEYDDLYNEEITHSIAGKDYNTDQLNEAFDNNEIGITEYCEGLSSIIKKRNAKLGNHYIRLVNIRQEIAASYGYSNYAEYAYDRNYDRDYSIKDLRDFRKNVKEYYSPLLTELFAGLEDYRDNIDAAEEVEVSQEECMDLVSEHFSDISDDLYTSFNYMRDHNLVDITKSEKKAPGAFTTSIGGKYNVPYLFNCSDEDLFSVGTLVHEFGHYNAMFYAGEELYKYDNCDLDLAEIHSQGLELLYTAYADDLYGEYAEALTYYSALNQVYGVVEGCKEDAFQYEVYTYNGDLTLDALNEIYGSLSEEYGDSNLYNSYFLGQYGYLNAGSIYEWVEIPHTFQSPLYYISYAISMAAVEEIRDIFINDPQAGIDKYIEIVSLGFDGKYSDALEEAGLNNPIENPRFDVYAENVRYSLDDSYAKESFDGDEEFEDDLFDDEEVKPGIKDRDRDRNRDRDKDSDIHEENDSAEKVIVIVAIALAALIFIAIIIGIVIAASVSKKKKAAALNNANGYNPNFNNPNYNYNSNYNSNYNNPNMNNGYGNTLNNYNNQYGSIGGQGNAYNQNIGNQYNGGVNLQSGQVNNYQQPNQYVQPTQVNNYGPNNQYQQPVQNVDANQFGVEQQATQPNNEENNN